MTTSALVLTLFLAWTLLLLVVMEVLRSYLVVTGRVRSNGFAPDNAGLSPFMQRLARAHANCIESLPVFGGLLLVALVTDRTGVTDALAPGCWARGSSSPASTWLRPASSPSMPASPPLPCKWALVFTGRGGCSACRSNEVGFIQIQTPRTLPGEPK